MAKVQIKGPIVSSGVKRIYEWFGIDATSPRDIEKSLVEANGEDLEVEINSGGGDVFSGTEIYTALKDYKGNVTVKIVGIAASAASVIAMAGKKVLISPPAQIMMHNVASFASGDYRAMEHSAEVLKNYNKSISNAYMLKTGLEQEKLLELMNKETWLNAQQAVEYGFADEVMFDDNNQLVASLGSTFVLPQEVINKVRNFIEKPADLTENFITNKSKEDEPLEIKNVDELRQHFPDLVNQLVAAAKEEGAKDERNRIKSIDEISNTIAPELVNKAKYEEPMTAEQLAFQSLKNDAAKGRQYLNDVAADNAKSKANEIPGQQGQQNQGKENEAKEVDDAVDFIANSANQRRR